jgi:hypothetical protein
MPKEKTTTRKAKGKAAAEGGKKKKGKFQSSRLEAIRQVTQCIDPNAPKRGLSAYMFFANEQRDNVREENPGITFGKHPSCPPARPLALAYFGWLTGMAWCRTSRQGSR